MPLDSGQCSPPNVQLGENIASDNTEKPKSTEKPNSTEKTNGTGKKQQRARRRTRRSGVDSSSLKSSRQPGEESSPKPSRPIQRYDTIFDRGVYSAIDLGTNNCRLLIARPTRHGFRIVDAFSRVVRLGEGLSHTNMLSEAAMSRTIEALKVCAEKINRRNVTCMRHVATEACRVADNCDEFILRVKEETGLNIDVISAREEARLAVMGCQSLIAPGNHNALVFDIGGGSTELIWVKMHPGRATEIAGWMSIPWGVVNLSEKFTPSNIDSDYILPTEKYREMVGAVKGHLTAFEQAHKISTTVNRRKTQLLGTSGTVTTLASLHMKLPRYNRDKVDGAWMKSSDIAALSHSVAGMSYGERAALASIGQERADLVVAGCAILEAILGMWRVPSLRVADRGIREGILRGMMQIETMPVQNSDKKKQRNVYAPHKQNHKGTPK
ncbi:Ppx/GppA phosphatase family protein [Kordiimonas pumila]|uniref:Ppx/GppA phosphatase family protein n=1 Tax=Kordiimonas pumila TaxID=2161677 RepID=A0ABV7D1D7_9PROT|nr:Ppx/GppA phosphatase family protein [Kordiimonas pumila]